MTGEQNFGHRTTQFRISRQSATSTRRIYGNSSPRFLTITWGYIPVD